MKTLKGGGMYIPISPDGNFMLTFGQNKIYVHSLPDLKTETFKTPLSHVSSAAMSHNGRLIAVKNTAGKVAVMEYPSGKILGVCPMEKSEGYASVCFSLDDSYVLDFDKSHPRICNIMKLKVPDADAAYDTPLKLKHQVLHKLDDTPPANIWYDEDSNRLFYIYNGYMFTSPLDEISFSKKELGAVPYFFCDVFIGKEYNAVNNSGGNVVIFDKKWNVINKFAPEIKENRSVGVSISDNGKMLYIRYMDKAYLFETACPKPVLEWSVGLTLAGARFINNDSMIAVSGWSGTIVEKLR